MEIIKGRQNTSGEYPSLLKKRALTALKWAKRAFKEGDYDIAVNNAEYAVQLYVKSIIYRILGEERSCHDIRSLLGVLASALIEQGLNEEANLVIDFIRANRRPIAELSDAHTRAMYSLFEYGEKEAKILIKIAEDIIEMLQTLEEKIFG